ncbi:MAG: GNAT family N-acetyltransferase, partial [Candidatus Thorarchaeota archaeon]
CLVGMLPAYRRRGITSMLIHSVLNTLIEHDCKYATVGTPTINYPAISMYEKLGFVDHSRLNWLVKSLD